ncbi:MAG: right-handed parallel beta-helix repeat-containing protein [bacterium]
MKDRSIQLFIAVLFTCFANVAVATDYYVATNGSDSNDGSIGAPWKTIMHSITVAGPGDTVFVREGTYSGEYVSIEAEQGHGGAVGQMLTIKPYPGEEVIFDSFQGFGMAANYTRVEGFNFTAASKGKGVAISDTKGGGEHNELVNCTFTGSGYTFAAIGVRGAFNLVEGCFINVSQATDLDHGIYLQQGHDNIIRGNHIENSGGYGIHSFDQFKGTQGEASSLRLADNIIENNFIKGCNRAGILIATGGGDIQNERITVRNNISIFNASVGIEVRRNAFDIYIYNNTIFGNAIGIGVGHVATKGNIDHVEITNNIIDMSETPPNDFGLFDHINVNQKGQIVITNVTANTNLYWGGTLSIVGVTDANSLWFDPLFVDTGLEDFHLNESSPAIDRGVNLEAVGADFEGTPRPQGETYDIGADEYGAATVPVALISFSASNDGESVQLQWTTAFESNNLGFEIERKVSSGDYGSIGFVDSQGASSSPQQYLYSDKVDREGIYTYRLKQFEIDGGFEILGTVQVTVELPDVFELHQNFPNPFNPSTEISFNVPVVGKVVLTVYNLLGQRIRTLVDEVVTEPGLKTVAWDAHDDLGQAVPSGIYFYRLETTQSVLSRRMVLLK